MNNTINESLINDSIQTTMPDMDVKIDTLPDLNDLIEFKDGIINIINDILHTIAPNYEVHIIVAFSALIAMVLKKKYDEDWIWWVIVTTVIFLAIRAVGISVYN